MPPALPPSPPLDILPMAIAIAERSASGELRLVETNPAMRARLAAVRRAERPARLFGLAPETLDAACSRAATQQRTQVCALVLDGAPHHLRITPWQGRFVLTLEAAAHPGHFQTIVQKSRDVIAIVDSKFRHVFVNDAILDATGMTPADFEGRDHREVGMPDSLVGYFHSVYERVFATGEDGTKEFDFPARDGRLRTYSVHITPLRDEQGNFEFVLATGHDVTERKRATEERLALERKREESHRLESLGLLAGGVAHDFNNLLQSILGNVQLARRGASPDDIDTRLADVESAALRAADLCAQMLAYTGRHPLRAEAVAPAELVRDTARLLAVTSPRARFEVELPDDLPDVLADRTQAQQVTLNVLRNALDALPSTGGSIRIAARVIAASELDWSTAIVAPHPDAEHLVELAIDDTGCGMDEETLARVFDPFFTTKSTMTSGGRGLGLASTLGVMRSHGGGLHVESAPGRGTRFRLYFRLATDLAPRVPSPPSAVSTAPSQAVVLLVEDDVSVREIVSLMLESEGRRVIVAGGGLAAVERFERHAAEISIALIDVTMPDIDGFETLRRLRALRPDLPAVLMSGYSTETFEGRLERDGRTTFLQKPFRHAELLELLDAGIRGGAALD